MIARTQTGQGRRSGGERERANRRNPCCCWFHELERRLAGFRLTGVASTKKGDRHNVSADRVRASAIDQAGERTYAATRKMIKEMERTYIPNLDIKVLDCMKFTSGHSLPSSRRACMRDCEWHGGLHTAARTDGGHSVLLLVLTAASQQQRKTEGPSLPLLARRPAGRPAT